jgi:hypothetical protein
VLSSGVGLSLATMAASRPSSAAAANNPSAADILKKPDWPEKWPFGPAELARYDEAPDTEFYSAPRFVTHIDDAAINALTAYYAKAFPASGRSDTALLDICSSWISHYPAGYTAGRISGLGMNEAELKRNSILNDYVVADLNATPKLPYPDNTFDVVTNAVSVDYLTKPLQVMQEVQRVLKPGGLALMSFSNRCFPTKAIAIWTSTGDLDHIWIVGASTLMKRIRCACFRFFDSDAKSAAQARTCTSPAALSRPRRWTFRPTRAAATPCTSSSGRRRRRRPRHDVANALNGSQLPLWSERGAAPNASAPSLW